VLAVDGLKLDRSHVQGLHATPVSQAELMSLEVVAGVETRASMSGCWPTGYASSRGTTSPRRSG
jgi:hypothetical protein